jgi:hypothetical protein
MMRPPLILGNLAYDELTTEVERLLKMLQHKLKKGSQYIQAVEERKGKPTKELEDYKKRLEYNQTLYEYMLAMFSRWKSIDYLFTARAIEQARANAHRLGKKDYGFSIFFHGSSEPIIQIH